MVVAGSLGAEISFEVVFVVSSFGEMISRGEVVPVSYLPPIWDNVSGAKIEV